LLVLGVLAVGVVWVARPVAHRAIGYFGKRAAARAGLRAEWVSSGSVWGGLVLDRVRVSGGEGAVVRSLTAERVAVEYDWWRVFRGGPGEVVRKVVIRQLEAEVDLTGREAVGGRRDGGGSAEAFRWPSVRVPAVDLAGVTVRVRVPGGMVEVDDVALSLDPARPGRVQAARVVVPGIPELREVAGTTMAGERSLRIEDLELWPEVVVEQVAVDWGKSAAGRVAVEVRARQGTAAVEVVGDLLPGADQGLGVQAEASLRRVSSETLGFWGVPDGGVVWEAGDVTLKADGPIGRPDLLVAGASWRGARVRWNDWPEASVDGVVEIGQGRAGLKEVTVQTGRGVATGRADVRLPRSWSEVVAAGGRASLEFEVPAVEAWMPEAVAVRGRAVGRAEADFTGGALTAATAVVDAAGVVVAGLPVERLTTRVTTGDGGRLQVAVDARLEGENGAEARGWLELRGDRPFEVTWKADCRDLATIPVEVRAGIPWPTAGTVVTTGTATGSLAAVAARDWGRLTGTAEVEATSLKIREASLAAMRLRARGRDGGLDVEELNVRLDDENGMSGSGRLAGGGPGASVSGRLRASLPSLARVSAWSTSFGGPPLRAGSLVADWEGGGAEAVASIKGTGSVRVRGLEVDGVGWPLGMEATVAQVGQEVSVSRLVATAGPWRAEGAGRWDGARVEVPALNVLINDRRVVRVDGGLPLGGGRGSGRDGVMDPDAPLALRLRVEALDLDRLGQDLGRPLPVRGQLTADGTVSGTLRTLTGSLTAEASGLRPAGPPVKNLDPATATLQAALRDGRLKVEGRVRQKPLEPLSVEVTAPVDPVALVRDPAAVRAIPLTGRVRMAESSLAFVPGWVPAVQSVRGTARVEATISGTVGQPRWNGGATVVLPEARLAGASLPSIKDVVVRLRADETRVIVEEAGVLVAGGRLRLQGGVDLARWPDPALDLRLTADEVLVVRDENLSLRANAGITCRGPLSRAAVSGTVDLVRGRVFKEVEFLPLSLPDQLPPPPPPTGLGRRGPPALPRPFDAWTVDLAIRTRDPIRLMGNVARGNVTTDLRLTGTGARPVLIGRAELGQMWVKLPFSRLNITEGAIDFTEDKPFDPQINVFGESVTGGRVVQVAVQGRALDPRVRLTSSPPLSEGDIAALLATGVTTGDLAAHGDEAAGRAAYVMLQQAYRKMFRNTSRRRDDAEPPRLSFELALFGNDPSRRSVSAVYELNPKWRVIGRVGESGTFRGLLYYLIRFR